MTGGNRTIFLIFLVLSFLFTPSPFQAADLQTAWVKTVVANDTFTGKVVGVSDGDTISVMRGGRALKVRLHGIDCPEKKQAFATKAKKFSSDLAFGKEGTVRNQTTDRYGRTVGVAILPDGKNLNWELVSAGLAWWYRKYAPDDRMLQKLEAEARDAKRGLWADKNPIPPWEWRRIQRGRRKK
jgi:endonuclease YncB( thermonuclease family)